MVHYVCVSSLWFSYKFGRKVSYINRLAELEQVLYLDRLDIPDEVKGSVNNTHHMLMYIHNTLFFYCIHAQ